MKLRVHNLKGCFKFKLDIFRFWLYTTKKENVSQNTVREKKKKNLTFSQWPKQILFLAIM